MLSRRKIAKIVQKATRKFGDVQERITYTQAGESVFDPAAGRASYPNAKVFEGVPVLPGVIDEKETTGKSPVDIRTDVKLIVAALDLPIVASSEDTLMFRGAVWNVIHVGDPPANAIHILYVRKA